MEKAGYQTLLQVNDNRPFIYRNRLAIIFSAAYPGVFVGLLPVIS